MATAISLSTINAVAATAVQTPIRPPQSKAAACSVESAFRDRILNDMQENGSDAGLKEVTSITDDLTKRMSQKNFDQMTDHEKDEIKSEEELLRFIELRQILKSELRANILLSEMIYHLRKDLKNGQFRLEHIESRKYVTSALLIKFFSINDDKIDPDFIIEYSQSNIVSDKCDIVLQFIKEMGDNNKDYIGKFQSFMDDNKLKIEYYKSKYGSMANIDAMAPIDQPFAKSFVSNY